jgi:protein SCO1/2
MEASEGKIGSTLDRIILFCYHYDPDANGYVVFAQNVMKVFGLACVAVLSLFIGGLWFRERRKKFHETLSTQVHEKELH